jgi:uncharacterized protein (TIGR02594 family)
MTVYEWVRGELGQKEILGKKDNPRIRWYHTSSANIGSKEWPDETSWCSSILNKGADECGYEKTDNALASSWLKYNVDAGDNVKVGDIVVIDGHVTLANKAFNRKTAKTFEGLGGNQDNQVKVSVYSASRIKAVRKWKKKAVASKPTKPVGSKIKSAFPKQEWTDFVQAQVEAHELHKVDVADGKDWCKDGMKSVESWVHLVACMSMRESSHKPTLTYKESFKNGKGEYVISSGLMQISLESIRQSAYNSQHIIKDQDDLFDPYKNLEASINVLAYWVKKDKQVGGGTKGAGRYWSVMRSPESVAKTKALLKSWC